MIFMATMEHIDMLTNVTADVLADMPNYANVEYDRDHARHMLTQYINLPCLGVFFKEVNGEVVGLYIGVVGPQWFSPAIELSEIMLWVRKDYRPADLGRRLIKVAEEWGISKGAKKVFLAAASGYETDRVIKLYNRMGYKDFSRIACKEV